MHAIGCGGPEVSVHIDPHAVGAAGRDHVEDTPIHRTHIDHVEHPDMLRIGREHPPCIRHIETAAIRAEGEAVCPLHVGDHGFDAALRRHPVDRAGQLLLRLCALVIRHDPVMRIAEPDHTVGSDNHIVRTIEPLALIAVGDDRDRSVPFGPRHPARSMLAADEPTLTVPCMAVRIVRRLAIGGHAILAPADDAVVGNVGKQEAAGIAEPHRPFRPVKPGRKPFYRGIAKHIGGEDRIDDFEKRHA